MTHGGYTTVIQLLHNYVIYRSNRDDFLLIAVDIGTYMRLDVPLGSAKKCLGNTYISLCGWKGVKLSPNLPTRFFRWIKTALKDALGNPFPQPGLLETIAAYRQI